jgi:hypothetical protein
MLAFSVTGHLGANDAFRIGLLTATDAADPVAGDLYIKGTDTWAIMRTDGCVKHVKTNRKRSILAHRPAFKENEVLMSLEQFLGLKLPME